MLGGKYQLMKTDAVFFEENDIPWVTPWIWNWSIVESALLQNMKISITYSLPLKDLGLI